MSLTYVEVGGTRGELPEGYHHVRRHELIGTGEPVFRVGAAALRRWEMHRASGLRVRAHGGTRFAPVEPARTTPALPVPDPKAPRPVAVGVRVACGAGVGALRIWVPCEVVWCLDKPRFFGFGYGTLPGHPECGEEAFELSLDDAGQVWFDIKAFSRPATWYSRLAGPVARAAQRRVTDRYVQAMRQIAATAVPPR